MRLDYHKLVRDGIPRIIEAGGGQPVTRVLDQAGYLAALRVKLMEEAEEAQAAPDRQLRSELADVLEVLRALAAAHGIALTSRLAAGLDPPSRGWLGHYAVRNEIPQSGLWNVEHVTARCDPGFLATLERLVQSSA